MTCAVGVRSRRHSDGGSRISHLTTECTHVFVASLIGTLLDRHAPRSSSGASALAKRSEDGHALTPRDMSRTECTAMALDMPAALRPACSPSYPHGPGLCLGSTPHDLLVRLASMVNANVMTVFDLPVTRKTAAAMPNHRVDGPTRPGIVGTRIHHRRRQ